MVLPQERIRVLQREAKELKEYLSGLTAAAGVKYRFCRAGLVDVRLWYECP